MLITSANLGRQRFAESETGGLYKSVAFNQSLQTVVKGTNWKAKTVKFGKGQVWCRIPEDAAGNHYYYLWIMYRRGLALQEILKEISYRRYYQDEPKYWLDFGNSQDTGQAITIYYREIKQPIQRNTKRRQACHLLPMSFGELLKQSEQRG